MIANYHTHTYRCHHASGTEREYIERAIEGGLKIMGFSDHMAFRFPDGFESGFRVPVNEVEDYFRTLDKLRDEYKNDIEIHIGWEMEYYPLHFEQMLKNAVEWGSEYLILGQHFTGNEHPGGKYCGDKTNGEKELCEYVDCVTAAIETGVFSCVCHPDVFRFPGEKSVYERENRRLCKAAAKAGIPLEINFLGIRDERRYPDMDFWKIAGEEGCRAVFGFDAHDAEAAYDSASEAQAQHIVDRFGLELVETLQLKPLK